MRVVDKYCFSFFFLNVQDSGGFQMVSLLKLAEITEVSIFTFTPFLTIISIFFFFFFFYNILFKYSCCILIHSSKEGVKFQSPHDGKEMLLTPEKSTEIQNSIGADIIMQLDDVVSSTTTGDAMATH